MEPKPLPSYASMCKARALLEFIGHISKEELLKAFSPMEISSSQNTFCPKCKSSIAIAGYWVRGIACHHDRLSLASDAQ